MGGAVQTLGEDGGCAPQTLRPTSESVQDYFTEFGRAGPLVGLVSPLQSSGLLESRRVFLWLSHEGEAPV